MKNRWSYDVPVDGISDRVLNMASLMQASRVCMDSDPATADSILKYACDSHYAPAKLLRARLLMNNPGVPMNQPERYAAAEKLLLELAGDLDASKQVMAGVSLELAKLYEMQRRPVGTLAMLLRARRFGSTAVRDPEIDQCRHKLERMDIHAYGTNAADAYALGMELFHANGPFKFTELFLREAADTARGELKGRACLALADLYAGNPGQGAALWEESVKLYRQAAEHGFAAYASPKCTPNQPGGYAQAK